MMSRILPWSALVLSLAALALSVRGRSAQDEVPAELPSELRELPTRAELEELERRMEELESTALSLGRRATALERRAGAPEGGAAVVAPGAEAPALAQQVAQLRAEVQGLMVGEVMHTPEGRERLRDAVRSVQEELVTERMRARQQALADARKQRLARFFEEARVGPSQKTELTRLLDAEEQRRLALLEEVRGGTKTWRDVRGELRTVRAETDAAAARVLDEAQRTSYQTMRREEWREQRPRREGRQEGSAP